MVRAQATAAVIDQFIESSLPGERIVADDRRARRCSTRTSRTSSSPTTRACCRSRPTTSPRRTSRSSSGSRSPTPTARWSPTPTGISSFNTRLDIEPSRGQARDPAIAAGQLASSSPDRSDAAVGDGRHAVQPVHEPGEHAGRDHGPAAGDGRRRVPGRRPRRRVPRPPVHHPAHAPDRGLPPARGGRPLVARRHRRGVLEHDSSCASCRSSSTRWPTGSSRASAIIRRDRDYSRDFLADVSHELRTPIAAMRTFIELLQGPAGKDPAARVEFLDSSAVTARPPRLARPEPARALEARLGARPARPPARRRPGHDRVGRGAAAGRRRSARASGSRRRCPIPPAAHPARPAAARPGRLQPRRQRAQVHRARRRIDVIAHR